MPKNTCVAVLEIGSEKITAAIAKKDEQVLNILGIGEVEYSGFLDAEWLNPSEIKQVVTTAISRAESSSGVKIREITVGIPAEFCYAKCKEASLFFDKPREITKEEIATLYKKSDKFSDQDYQTINVSPVYFLLNDNKRIIEPCGLESDEIRALVSYVRCKKDFINDIESILSEIGTVKFVPSPWAEIMSLFEPKERDRYVLLADVGYITTEVTLLRGDGILNLTSFSLGAGHITGNISEAFEISFKEAELLKRKTELFYRGDKQIAIEGKKTKSSIEEGVLLQDLSIVVEESIEEIVDNIKESIKQGEYNCPPHVPLYVTGGGLGFIKRAKEFIAANIDRPVEIVVPNLDKFNKPNYTALFGLFNIAINDMIQQELEKSNKSKFEELIAKIIKFFGGKKIND